MSYEYKSIYAPYITKYIEMKQVLGFKFEAVSSFRLFDQFAIENELADSGITRELCELWLKRRSSEAEVSRYKRALALRGLAQYMNSVGVDAYVPRLPGNCKSTFTPHIYTRDELRRFFAACDEFEITPHTYTYPLLPALFRLLYGTGLRIGEALGLRDEDVNLESGVIILHHTKNCEERLIPLSASLSKVLTEYAASFAGNHTADSFFFTKRNGSRLTQGDVHKAFRILLAKSGIPYGGRGKGPRVHDFRHTFSVHSLVKLQDDGRDLYNAMPILAKYIGHKNLSATENYVRLTEEMFPTVLEKNHAIRAYVFPEVPKL